MTDQAITLFLETLEWFKDHYGEQEYWNESDVGCTLWYGLSRKNTEAGSPFSVRSQFPLDKGNRSDRVDLAILDRSGRALVVVELKYEPDLKRPGVIQKIGNVGHLLPAHRPLSIKSDDITKIEACVSSGKATAGFAVLVDEGSHHIAHPLSSQIPAGCDWRRWGRTAVKGYDVSLLVFRYPVAQAVSP
ncbi:MAG: hypothetical protein ACLQU5_19365 [Isosphaeraceae bacterium]